MFNRCESGQEHHLWTAAPSAESSDAKRFRQSGSSILPVRHFSGRISDGYLHYDTRCEHSLPDYFASLAQPAERHFRKVDVVGANPTGGSTIYGCMHDHILRRISESDEDSEKRYRLREILKELRKHTDVQGVGTLARDLDDILNVPLAE